MDLSRKRAQIERKLEEERRRRIERIVSRLRAIDQRVRAHELAHMSVGGQYAGAPHYTYVKGPDGQLYAVAGEVPIDVSPEKDPEATVKKMQQVIAAALAPADPSPQDYKVAALASQQLMQALNELAKKKAKKLYGHFSKSGGYLEREIERHKGVQNQPPGEPKGVGEPNGGEPNIEPSKGEKVKEAVPAVERGRETHSGTQEKNKTLYGELSELPLSP